MKRIEDQIQETIFDHYLARACDRVFAFAVPNAARRSWAGAALAKKTGLRSGVPDTIWIREGQAFGLELKAPRGRTSDNQILALEEMEGAGAICHVAYGLDDALQWLEGQRLLKGVTA